MTTWTCRKHGSIFVRTHDDTKRTRCPHDQSAPQQISQIELRLLHKPVIHPARTPIFGKSCRCIQCVQPPTHTYIHSATTEWFLAHDAISGTSADVSRHDHALRTLAAPCSTFVLFEWLGNDLLNRPRLCIPAHDHAICARTQQVSTPNPHPCTTCTRIHPRAQCTPQVLRNAVTVRFVDGQQVDNVNIIGCFTAHMRVHTARCVLVGKVSKKLCAEEEPTYRPTGSHARPLTQLVCFFSFRSGGTTAVAPSACGCCTTCNAMRQAQEGIACRLLWTHTPQTPHPAHLEPDQCRRNVPYQHRRVQTASRQHSAVWSPREINDVGGVRSERQHRRPVLSIHRRLSRASVRCCRRRSGS